MAHRRIGCLTVLATAALCLFARHAVAGAFSSLPRYEKVQMLWTAEDFEDFEKPELDSHWHAERGAKAELVATHATGGKQALQVVFPRQESRLRYRRTGLDGYGSNYSRSLEVLGARFILHNRFSLDVFNPGEKSVQLVVTFAQQPFVFSVKPGANTIRIPTEEIASSVYRMTQATHRIVFSVQGSPGAVLVFDSLRLERETVGPNMKEHAKCFDFGPEDMVRPGFLPVDEKTGYESRRGYGWLEPNMNDEKGKLTVTKATGAMPLGDLIRDGVAQLSSEFLLDCPEGKYRVHIVGGHLRGGIYELTPTDYDFTIKAEGTVKHLEVRAGDQRERVARFYGHDETRYEFDEDIWAKFGEPVFRPVVFDVEVTDGQLNIQFLTSPQPDKGFLNFMIVYPTEEAAKVEPELNRVLYDVRRRYNRVSFRMLDPVLAAALKKPDLHEEYLNPHGRLEKIARLVGRPEFSGRDFLIFSRNHLTQVYPDTVPDTEEEVTRLEAVGAPGEVVPVTFSIFPLHPMKDTHLQVETLRGPSERGIGLDDMDVRLVRYSRRMLAQRTRGDWQYMVVPWYLVRFGSVDIDRYLSRRFWINVRLAPELAPGQYTGRVRIIPSESGEVLLKLDVHVLPLHLREPEEGRFGVVHVVQPLNPGNEPFGYTLRRQMTQGLPREHAQDVQSLIEKYHRREIAATLALLRSYGFSRAYVGDWLKDIQEANLMLREPLKLVNLFEASRAAKSRPEKKGGRDAFVYVDKQARRAYLSALKSYNADTVGELKAEGLSVAFGRPTAGTPVMDDPAVARFLIGVFLWRLGADAVLAGPARSSWGDPYCPFDGPGGERGSLLLPSSRFWPRANASRILEEMREGIEDYRYLITLERLIQSAGETEPANEAREFLARLRREMSGVLADYVEPNGIGTWRAIPGKCWDAEDYGTLRRRLTMHILSVTGTPEEAERQ